MGALADLLGRDFLRLENLDTDIPPEPEAIVRTRLSVVRDDANSYLPFVGQDNLREAVVRHVSSLSGVEYEKENVIICAGGLSGILNVLLATIEVGDEVIVTDPTYAGLINRIRLAGGTPVFTPLLFNPGKPWALDRRALTEQVSPRTRALLLMSPSMPSGMTFDEGDWRTICDLCVKLDLLLILDSAMERLLFDRRTLLHPVGMPGMAERTIIIGAASKELRMIGWRVGWIVAPKALIPDLTAVSLANVVVPVGIAQDATAMALDLSRGTLPEYVGELERRRDTVARALSGFPFGMPGGGWSLLLRVSDFAMDGAEMAARLFKHDVCATPMAGWGGQQAGQYIRFVYANEPVHRLKNLQSRIYAALE